MTEHVEAVGERERAAEPSAEQLRDAPVQAMLRVARERFKLAAEAEASSRGEALSDMKFSIGEQWPEDVKSQRTNEMRPCLTINRIPGFLRQVTNEQRQQRPSVQVSPVGDGADAEIAEVLQGVVRHIEQDSHADIAYDTAGDRAARMGWGYVRIVTEYEGDRSFRQKIKIKKVDNSFMVYYDPAASEPDKRDAGWCFVVKDYGKDEYKHAFPGSRLASLVDWSSVGDQAPGWLSKDNVRVAEYFRVEHDPRRLVELAGGGAKFEDELEEDDVVDPDGETRIVNVRRVVWSKINAVEELASTEWPGRWIPVVPVVGEEVDVDGKIYRAGMVRDLKDPQRRYNYMVSAETEGIALAPKAPYVGAEGQFENFENQWKNANVRSFPYLQYKPVSLEGQPLPPPQRQQFEPPIQAITRGIAQADNDMKAVTSLYDASLGQPGPEQSGKAILARKVQGSLANLNYTDNLGRAIRFVGLQLIDLIPKVYGIGTVMRILAPDGDSRFAGIYDSTQVGHDEARDKLLPGVMDSLPVRPGMTTADALKIAARRIYDVGVGTYDVVADMGPSYESRRQEAVASMLEFAKAFPQAAPMIQDLVAGNMDWPGAKQIAARLKMLLPPQLQQEGDDAPGMNPQQLQAQLQALSSQHAQLVAALNKANGLLQSKNLEIASRERIAALNAQTQLLVAEFKSRSVENIELLRQRLTDARAELDRLVNEAGNVPAAAPQAAAPTAGEQPGEGPSNGGQS